MKLSTVLACVHTCLVALLAEKSFIRGLLAKHNSDFDFVIFGFFFICLCSKIWFLFLASESFAELETEIAVLHWKQDFPVNERLPKLFPSNYTLGLVHIAASTTSYQSLVLVGRINLFKFGDSDSLAPTTRQIYGYLAPTPPSPVSARRRHSLVNQSCFIVSARRNRIAAQHRNES